MATQFDGEALICTLDSPVSGVLDLDFAVLYKEWKQWQLAAPGRRGYPPMFFDNFGGNNLLTGLDAGAYFIMQNHRGWRLRPSEADQTINMIGNLIPSDSSLPVAVPTLGGFTVMGFGLQPVTQSVSSLATDTEFLRKIVTNHKELKKVASSWYLIIYDDGEVSGGTPILNKKMTDSTGADITDLAAGTLAVELENSV